MSDLLVDHALTLLLADEPDAALRWGAAALEHDPSTPGALVVTSRLLEQLGRTRAAVDGLRMAVRRATDAGNLPLAVAAVEDLRKLGVDVSGHLDQVADAFCQGSPRLEKGDRPPALPEFVEIQPLSPFLTGPSLASKATQILQVAKRLDGEIIHAGALAGLAPLPLFSALPKEALRDLLAAFEMITVPAGHHVVHEGRQAAAAYFVARGELEISRRTSDGEKKPPLVLARVGWGAFFGEMALLGHLPGAASVKATRPSILLAVTREALEAIGAKYPAASAELAAHCRRHLVANLGWASPVVAAIPAPERAVLVEKLQTRLFEKGDLLVDDGEGPQGLHLIVSGEVAVVGRDRGARVVLATLTPGETVGEVELVLCRRAIADAIAVRPTATLFLPRADFYTLAQDHPAILHGLYGIAVRRQTETQLALDGGATLVEDDWMLDEKTTIIEKPVLTPALARHTLPLVTAAEAPAAAAPVDLPRQANRASLTSELGRAVATSARSLITEEPDGSFTRTPTTLLPSIAPTSASVPSRPAASRREPRQWRALVPATALVAAAAGVAIVVAMGTSTGVGGTKPGQGAIGATRDVGRPNATGLASSALPTESPAPRMQVGTPPPPAVTLAPLDSASTALAPGASSSASEPGKAVAARSKSGAAPAPLGVAVGKATPTRVVPPLAPRTSAAAKSETAPSDGEFGGRE